MSGKKEKELIEKMGRIAQAPVQVFPAFVSAINENVSTVDVRDMHGSEFFNVRLKASVDQEQLRVIMVPELESSVLVGLIGNNENALYLIHPSKVNKILANVAGTKIKVDENGIVINDAENGPVLVSQSLIDDLNAVKQDLNDLKTVFSGWVTSPSDGGAALKTAASSWYGSQLTDTELADVTNEKLKH